MSEQEKTPEEIEETQTSENAVETDAATVQTDEVAEEATTEAPTAEETIARLQKELEEARAQAEEYLDGWRRARADLSNYRKRVEQEREALTKLASAALITRLLPILDDFERAFQTLPDPLRLWTWVDGIALIHRKFQATLENEGLVAIPVQPGDEFDPAVHEAITHEPHPEFPEGTIIAEVQRGYKIGDRVIRPTLVRVSSGAPQAEEVSAEEESTSEEEPAQSTTDERKSASEG